MGASPRPADEHISGSMETVSAKPVSRARNGWDFAPLEVVSSLTLVDQLEPHLRNHAIYQFVVRFQWQRCFDLRMKTDSKRLRVQEFFRQQAVIKTASPSEPAAAALCKCKARKT